MDELIWKQTVLNMIDDVQFGNITHKLSQLHEAVKNLPSVDAVEVVRCKDCDNFQTDWETAFANGRHYCAIMDSIMPPEGFCSYGERKTDG